MAKSLSVNYTDTAIAGATAPQITVPVLNYSTDFRVRQDEPNESIIANLTSPISQPERIRIAQQDVADVYRNTGIDPTMYYQSRRGTQVLLQLTDVFKVSDGTDASYEALLPISVHMVIKVPNNDLITSDICMNEVARLLGALYETNASGTTSNRLSSMLRGALLPASL